MSEPIGRLDLVALDCPDPVALAEFYRSILGGEIEQGGAFVWVEMHTAGGTIAFQKVDEHRPPTWPTGAVPQQAHLDIDVVDLDTAERAAIAKGAVKAATQPKPDEFRVFIDPAGHPFCLVDVTHS